MVNQEHIVRDLCYSHLQSGVCRPWAIVTYRLCKLCRRAGMRAKMIKFYYSAMSTLGIIMAAIVV